MKRLRSRARWWQPVASVCAALALTLATASCGSDDADKADGPDTNATSSQPAGEGSGPDEGPAEVDFGDVRIEGLSGLGPVCELFSEEQAQRIAPDSDGVDVSGDDYSCIRGSGETGAGIIDGGYVFYENQGGTVDGFEYVAGVGADAYFSTPSTGEPAIYVRVVNTAGTLGADFYLVAGLKVAEDDPEVRDRLREVAIEIVDDIVVLLDAEEEGGGETEPTNSADLEQCETDTRTLKTAITAWNATGSYATAWPTSEADLVAEGVLGEESDLHTLSGSGDEPPTIDKEPGMCADEVIDQLE